YAAIRERNEEHGLSRLTATFDWEFVEKRSNNGKTWDVEIDTFRMPWNLQLEYSAAERRDLRGRSWAERTRSIDEVGSTFTVQGFDLDYAGVIIGPSVTYRDGQIVFNPLASANRNATQRRTLSDGSKATVAEDLLRNELNVLLTRGVRGLYLYAVDPELREALLTAQQP
ncbi:DNA/RNA helicase domain-containing protein, partial [Corynebacterium variabile]|uniref:DNA/RNA helicase domain-containing protein n=1 Tax=Corynebacterium variabile TaxID=1727 RepID=UPI002FE3E658